MVEEACNVGLMLPTLRGLSNLELLEIVRRADEVGLSGVASGEHASNEAFGLIGAMAVSTQRIRLETAIVSPLARSPALTAMAAATIAELSGNRFVLGIGSGSPIIAGWHQRDFSKPLTRMREFVQLVRSALDGERLNAAASFRLLRPPEQRVKILIGAANPKMLELAAEIGDGVILNFVSVDQMSHQVAELRRMRAANVTGLPLEVLAIQWAWMGDIEAGRRAFAHEMGPYLAVATYADAAAAIIGTEAVAAIAQAWRAGGRLAAARLIPDELASALAVIGGREELAERTARLGAAGCDAVRYLPLTPQDGDGSQLRRLVEELGGLTR